MTVALVAEDGQLHLHGPEGSRALTLDPRALGMWGTPPTVWAWPSFRPDGRAVVAFEQPEAEDQATPVQVQVLEIDSPRQHLLLRLEDQLPLYAAWRPDGRAVALLLQDEDELSLGVVQLDDLGTLHEVEAGGPLFFSWVGERLMIRAGTDAVARVVVRDPLGTREDQHLGDAGDFCTPLQVDDHLVVVRRSGARSALEVLDPDGRTQHTVDRFQGLAALVQRDDRVLFSVATGGQGTPYDGVRELDPRTGTVRQITASRALAFFPVPGGGLVLAQVDRDRNALRWVLERDGAQTELAAFWPTREQLWHLQFFEQFVATHPPVDRDRLVFAGHLLDDRQAPPSVFQVDLNTGEHTVLARGTFGTLSPGPMRRTTDRPA